MSTRVIQIIGGFLVLMLALCVISIPMTVAIVLASLVTAALARSGDRWAVTMVAGSILFCVIALEGILRLTGAAAIYYRVDEMFGLGDHYQPFANLRGFHQPYGDLFAIAKFSTPTIVDPRTVDFVTDSLGNRNSQNYSGESLVLIGDSFGVGSGTSQEDTLAEALSRELGQRVYNASYPGAPIDYLHWRARLEKQVGKSSKSIFLFFEGNDLPCPGDNWSAVSNIAPWYLDVPAWIKPLATYRFFFGLHQRALALTADAADANVTVARVGDKDMGFFNLYRNATRQSTECGWDDLISNYRTFAHSTALIAMAPTKYRVYHGFLNPDPDPALLNVRWRFIERLGREIGVPTLDLTPFLIDEARRQLHLGKYVYWRDDTHWNGLGIAVAAKAIVGVLKDRERQPVLSSVGNETQSSLGRVRFQGALVSATAPDGWFGAGPSVVANADGVTGDAASQIYRSLVVPVDSRRLIASIALSSEINLGTVLVDTIWQKDGVELSRSTSSLMPQANQVQPFEIRREVPSGADHLLLIVRPWRTLDGKVTVGSGWLSWH